MPRPDLLKQVRVVAARSPDQRGQIGGQTAVRFAERIVGHLPVEADTVRLPRVVEQQEAFIFAVVKVGLAPEQRF